MSAPLPAGPELDAAVARALGWRCYPLPFASLLGTSTQPMLDWLTDVIGGASITMENWIPTAGSTAWKATAEYGRGAYSAVGETLQLALARLVVAVAEAAKEAKP